MRRHPPDPSQTSMRASLRCAALWPPLCVALGCCGAVGPTGGGRAAERRRCGFSGRVECRSGADMRRQLDHHVDMQKTDANVRDQSEAPIHCAASQHSEYHLVVKSL